MAAPSKNFSMTPPGSWNPLPEHPARVVATTSDAHRRCLHSAQLDGPHGGLGDGRPTMCGLVRSGGRSIRSDHFETFKPLTRTGGRHDSSCGSVRTCCVVFERRLTAPSVKGDEMSRPQSQAEYLARLVPPSVAARGIDRRALLRGAL